MQNCLDALTPEATGCNDKGAARSVQFCMITLGLVVPLPPRKPPTADASGGSSWRRIGEPSSPAGLLRRSAGSSSLHPLSTTKAPDR